MSDRDYQIYRSIVGEIPDVLRAWDRLGESDRKLAFAELSRGLAAREELTSDDSRVAAVDDRLRSLAVKIQEHMSVDVCGILDLLVPARDATLAASPVSHFVIYDDSPQFSTNSSLEYLHAGR